MRKMSMRAAEDLTIIESYDFFIRRCEVFNLSPQAIELYRCHFRGFMRFIDDDDFLIKNINLRIVEDFIFHLKSDNKCKDDSPQP